MSSYVWLVYVGQVSVVVKEAEEKKQAINRDLRRKAHNLSNHMYLLAVDCEVLT